MEKKSKISKSNTYNYSSMNKKNHIYTYEKILTTPVSFAEHRRIPIGLANCASMKNDLTTSFSELHVKSETKHKLAFNIYSSNWHSPISGHVLHSIFHTVCEMVECFLHSCVFIIILVASIILASPLNSNIQRLSNNWTTFPNTGGAAQLVRRVALLQLLTSLILFVYIWLAREVEVYKVRR